MASEAGRTGTVGGSVYSAAKARVYLMMFDATALRRIGLPEDVAASGPASSEDRGTDAARLRVVIRPKPSYSSEPQPRILRSLPFEPKLARSVPEALERLVLTRSVFLALACASASGLPGRLSTALVITLPAVPCGQQDPQHGDFAGISRPRTVDHCGRLSPRRARDRAAAGRRRRRPGSPCLRSRRGCATRSASARRDARPARARGGPPSHPRRPGSSHP